MGISGQTIWRQAGNFLRKQKIIRKITYYESGFTPLSQNNSVEISKNANCIAENINSSQSPSLCVGDNLKPILDSNAILKDDDKLCTNGLISHSQKKLKCQISVSSLHQPADKKHIIYACTHRRRREGGRRVKFTLDTGNATTNR